MTPKEHVRGVEKNVCMQSIKPYKEFPKDNSTFQTNKNKLRRCQIPTTAASNHCWQCHYNFKKRLRNFLLIIHNASFLN